MNTTNGIAGHPIKIAANRSGLSPHVIRVWERRYGAVEPLRTETNRRLYSDEDIERLRLLHQATTNGHSIGNIARLSAEALNDLIGTDPPAPPFSAPAPAAAPLQTGAPDSIEARIERCISAIAQLDASRLEGELARAAVSLSQPQFLEMLVEPLMRRVGDLWRQGTLRVADEHLASAVVRTFVRGMQAAYQTSPNSPRIVIGTPAGQKHELGALMAATMATAEGWNVTYLGAELPAEELAGAVQQSGASSLGLSIVYPGDDPSLPTELARLRKLLGSEVNILIGGSAAADYLSTIEAIGALHVEGVAAYRQQLENLRRPSPPGP